MKMSKKYKEENVFFLKTSIRSRLCYNDMCKSCKNDCKQSYKVIELKCPDYAPKKKVG